MQVKFTEVPGESQAGTKGSKRLAENAESDQNKQQKLDVERIVSAQIESTMKDTKDALLAEVTSRVSEVRDGVDAKIDSALKNFGSNMQTQIGTAINDNFKKMMALMGPSAGLPKLQMTDGLGGGKPPALCGQPGSQPLTYNNVNALSASAPQFQLQSAVPTTSIGRFPSLWSQHIHTQSVDRIHADQLAVRDRQVLDSNLLLQQQMDAYNRGFNHRSPPY